MSTPSDAIQCKPLEVAVGDKGIERAIKHLKRKITGQEVVFEQHAVLQGLVPALDLALGLRVERRATHMAPCFLRARYSPPGRPRCSWGHYR